jgi:hypothetical protein
MVFDCTEPSLTLVEGIYMGSWAKAVGALPHPWI